MKVKNVVDHVRMLFVLNISGSLNFNSLKKVKCNNVEFHLVSLPKESESTQTFYVIRLVLIRAILSDLIGNEPTPGFILLSRYVDTLANIHHLALAPLILRSEKNSIIDISKVVIIAHAHHSLVVSDQSTSVFKISLTSLIDREVRIHKLVDGTSPYLRRMITHGKVEGVGDNLSFIQLEGFGVPFNSQVFSKEEEKDFLMFWGHASKALKSLHDNKVIHRDIKPNNMIIIKGTLMLNDFDVSCCTTDDANLLKCNKHHEVGTSKFRSPKLKDYWRQRDDWLSLILSFASFRLPIEETTLDLIYNQKYEWVPPEWIDIIKDSYSK